MYDDLKDELYHAFGALKRHKRSIFDIDRLPFPEFRVLQVIREMPGGKCGVCGREVYVSEIGQRLNMSMPAVSQVLNTLEKKNYVTRSIGENDRRKIRVMVTDEGVNALLSAREYTDAALEVIAGKLGEADMRELVRLVIKLNKILDEIKTEKESRQK